MKFRLSKDPLAPLEGIVSAFLTIAIFTLVAGIALIPFNGTSGFGMGDSEVCVDNANVIIVGGEENPGEDKLRNFKAHTRSFVGETTVCNTKPGIKEQALSGLTVMPTFLVFAGFLFLTDRSIKRARSHGLFTLDTARRVQRIGRFLLIGLIAAALVEWIAKGLLLSTMIEGKDWADGPPYISIPSIIGALGIVTVGRILQRAVALQDEADATV